MGKGDKAFFSLSLSFLVVVWAVVVGGEGGVGLGAYYLTVFQTRPQATARTFKSKQVRQITQGLLLNELPP